MVCIMPCLAAEEGTENVTEATEVTTKATTEATTKKVEGARSSSLGAGAC